MGIFDLANAELPQEGILFRTQFPSLGIFIKVQRANLTCDVIRNVAPFVLSKL